MTKLEVISFHSFFITAAMQPIFSDFSFFLLKKRIDAGAFISQFECQKSHKTLLLGQQDVFSLLNTTCVAHSFKIIFYLHE